MPIPIPPQHTSGPPSRPFRNRQSPRKAAPPPAWLHILSGALPHLSGLPLRSIKASARTQPLTNHRLHAGWVGRQLRHPLLLPTFLGARPIRPFTEAFLNLHPGICSDLQTNPPGASRRAVRTPLQALSARPSSEDHRPSSFPVISNISLVPSLSRNWPRLPSVSAPSAPPNSILGAQPKRSATDPVSFGKFSI